jgi:tripartite-type tricarboxylate transporter receptor subunit TctC
MAKNPFLYPTSSYDPVVDLAPVTKLTEFTNVMVVPNSSRVMSVKEFIAHAKANRGKIIANLPGRGVMGLVATRSLPWRQPTTFPTHLSRAPSLFCD